MFFYNLVLIFISHIIAWDYQLVINNLVVFVISWTLTLIKRENDTRSWGNFSALFLTQCHTNLRGYG
jgi:hypothetical protein